MYVGIVGVPPWDGMQAYLKQGARIFDLDEPLPEYPVRDIYLPNAYCSILKRVVSNIFSLRGAGRLDLVLAAVGKCKCDGMRNIASWLDRRLQWDPVKEEILGDFEASQWLSRPTRAPWHLS